MILQQMVDEIKTEKDVDAQSEQGSSVTEMGGVHMPSTFSVQEAEPEVSCFEIVLHCCFCRCVAVVCCYGGPLVSEGDVIVLCEFDSAPIQIPNIIFTYCYFQVPQF